MQETDFQPCSLRCHTPRQSWRCTCLAHSWSRCPRTRCTRHSFDSLAFLVKSHCPCLRHVTLILAQSTANSIRASFPPFSWQSKPGLKSHHLARRASAAHWPTRYPCQAASLLPSSCRSHSNSLPTSIRGGTASTGVSFLDQIEQRFPQMRQGNLSDSPMLSFPRLTDTAYFLPRLSHTHVPNLGIAGGHRNR